MLLTCCVSRLPLQLCTVETSSRDPLPSAFSKWEQESAATHLQKTQRTPPKTSSTQKLLQQYPVEYRPQKNRYLNVEVIWQSERVKNYRNICQSSLNLFSKQLNFLNTLLTLLARLARLMSVRQLAVDFLPLQYIPLGDFPLKTSCSLCPSSSTLMVKLGVPSASSTSQ